MGERRRGTEKKYDVDELIEKINKYTETTTIPIFKEICYLNGWNYHYLYDRLSQKQPRLKEAIQHLMDKKEAQIEKLALYKELDSRMAQFSLAQLGWRNEQSIRHSGPGGGAVKIRWMSMEEAKEAEEEE